MLNSTFFLTGTCAMTPSHYAMLLWYLIIQKLEPPPIKKSMNNSNMLSVSFMFLYWDLKKLYECTPNTDVSMDKPHPWFMASTLWKKVRLIHGRLRYSKWKKIWREKKIWRIRNIIRNGIKSYYLGLLKVQFSWLRIFITNHSTMNKYGNPDIAYKVTSTE